MTTPDIPPIVFGIVSPGRWGRKLLDPAKASPRLAFGGVFSRNPAMHYFDVLQFLFGPARRVTGFVQRPSPHAPTDTARAALHFDGGIIPSYTTYAASVGLSRMILLGSKGAPELNRMGQDACTWQPVSALATSRLGGLPPQPIKFEGPYLVTTALTAELEGFAGAIRERRRPQVGAAESLSTLRISCAVLEASATGRTIQL